VYERGTIVEAILSSNHITTLHNTKKAPGEHSSQNVGPNEASSSSTLFSNPSPPKAERERQ